MHAPVIRPSPHCSRGRPLTAGERKLAEGVFGTSLELESVRLICGAWMYLLRWPALAMAPNGHVYFAPKIYRDDYARAGTRLQALLVHELAHVRQYQQGRCVWFEGLLILLRGGYGRGRRLYTYAPSPGPEAGIEQDAVYWERKFLQRVK